jgi:hypothetical protein
LAHALQQRRESADGHGDAHPPNSDVEPHLGPEGSARRLERIALLPPPSFCRDVELPVTLKPLELELEPTMGDLARMALDLVRQLSSARGSM